MTVIPPLLWLLSIERVTNFYIHSLLNEQADLVSDNFYQVKSKIKAFDQSQIFNRFDFDCKEDDLALITSLEVSPLEVRVAQLVLADGSYCSNVENSLKIETQALKPISGTKAFYSTNKVSYMPARVTAVVYPLGENQLTFISNSAYFESNFIETCKDCMRVVHIVDNDHPLYSGARELPHDIFYASTERELIDYVTIKIEAGDRMYVWAKKQVTQFSIWLSIGLIIVLNLLYWIVTQTSLSIKSMIKKAIRQDEFIPYYQPIIDQSTNEIIGQEVLIRWVKDGKVHMNPDQFIPIAEDNALIVPITRSMIKHVKRDLPKLKGWVSINVVGSMLEEGHLSKWLINNDCEHTKKICFEITERSPINHFDKALAEINKVEPYCLGFKMDDFGTGFGGFSYLQKIGCKSIKIDKMFIDTIGTNDLKISVLDSIIAFGHESKLEMIAEGVETEEQKTYLRQKGINLIQGYCYAKPMSFSALTTFYQQHDLKAVEQTD